jgi:hypothetical protein
MSTTDAMAEKSRLKIGVPQKMYFTNAAPIAFCLTC